MPFRMSRRSWWHLRGGLLFEVSVKPGQAQATFLAESECNVALAGCVIEL